MESSKVIRGTFGKLYVNNVRYANVKSFELTMNMHYETIQVNGEMCDQQVYTGYDLAGTIELHKISSYSANLVKDAVKTGSMPDIKFVATIDDPNADGADTIEVEKVTFDSVTLLQFENGTVGSESIPFKAGGFNYIDINTSV